MTNEEKMYQILLEDYGVPRSFPDLAPYFGSITDLMGFATNLANNSKTAARYRETLNAFNQVSENPDVSHTMGGQLVPLLRPARVVARKTLSFDSPRWLHQADKSIAFLMSADSCEAEILLTEVGDQMFFCVKASGKNVRAHLSDMKIIRWDSTNLFPGLIEEQEGVRSTRLFIPIMNVEAPLQQIVRALFDDPDFFASDLDSILSVLSPSFHSILAQ